MLLDPFTIVAQIINFAILAVALKYLLFDRVVEAIDERERDIRSRLDDAAEREEKAEQRAEELQQARDELEERRDELLDEAKSEAATRREELLAAARDDVEQRRREWEREDRREREELRRDLRRMTADGVFEVGRDAFARIADADLEERVIEIAFDRFESDDVGERLFGSDAAIKVHTSFELTDAARELVRERLADLGAGDNDVVFERDPELLLGVRLQLETVSVDWSLDDYLERLEDAVEATLSDRLDDSDRSPEGDAPDDETERARTEHEDRDETDHEETDHDEMDHDEMSGDGHGHRRTTVSR